MSTFLQKNFEPKVFFKTYALWNDTLAFHKTVREDTQKFDFFSCRTPKVPLIDQSGLNFFFQFFSFDENSFFLLSG